MTKLLALMVLSTSLLSGCFTATGAVIGHEVAKHQTPYNDNNAQEAGIAFGVAADVVTTVLIVSALSSATSSENGGFYPYGAPGQGN